MRFKEYSYVLCGIAEYKGECTNDNTGHYIAYCRNFNNIWLRKNDLNQESQRINVVNHPSIIITYIHLNEHSS